MVLAAQLVAALVATAAPQAPNTHLSKGIALWEKGDPSGALTALTTALETADNQRDQARGHLYIGLIQVQFAEVDRQLLRDARVNFVKALQYDKAIRLPKGAPAEAKRIFRQLSGTNEPPPKKPPPRGRPKEREPPVSVTPVPLVPVEPGLRPLQPSGEPSGTPLPEGERPSEDGRSMQPVPMTQLRDPNVTVVPPPLPPPRIEEGYTRPSIVETEIEEEEEDDELDKPGIPVAPIIVAAVGVAVVTTGLVMMSVSASTNEKAFLEPVSVRAMELHETAVSQRTIAIIGLTLGTIGLGTAGALFVFD